MSAFWPIVARRYLSSRSYILHATSFALCVIYGGAVSGNPLPSLLSFVPKGL